MKPAILYVDDEVLNLFLFERAFRDKREVITAGSPSIGLSKLHDNLGRISLVITDIHMPEMNGVQFIEKALRKAGNIPYLVLSGFEYDDEIDTAIKDRKVRKFFSKPFNRSEIEDYLDQLKA